MVAGMIASGTGSRVLRALILVAALLGIILFLRLPGLSNSFCSPDQGETAYSSRLLLDGRCPYSEAISSKPAGTIVLYALLFSLFGYRVLPIQIFAVLWILAAALLVYRIGSRTISTRAGLLSAGMYGFYQADLTSVGSCANCETWTILPALGSLALVIDPQSGRIKTACAGALACLGVWMKQPAVFFAAAAVILIFASAFRSTSKVKYRQALTRLSWFTAGAIVCCIPFFLQLASISCLDSMFVELNPLKAIGYIKSFDSELRWTFRVFHLREFLSSNLLLVLVTAAGIISGLRFGITSGRRSPFLGILLFLLAAVMFVISTGHFYGHYFVVVLPFMCLLSGFFLHLVPVFSRRPFTVAVTVMLCLSTLVDSRYEMKLARMSAESLLASGSVMSEAIFETNYSDGFGSSNPIISRLEWQPTYREVSRFLRNNLQEGQTVWCFDFTPEIYFYAMTFSPTKHQEHFEIVTHSRNPEYGLWHHEVDGEVLKNRAQCMAELMEAPPAFIIRFASDCRRRPLNYSRGYHEDWAENNYGFPVKWCYDKMVAFDALEVFLAENYRMIDPPLNRAIDIYEFRGDGPLVEQAR